MDGNFSLPAALSRAVPIDHAHLARYTMGNRALEIEVLQLFAGQAPSTLASLRDAGCAKSWHMAAHTLKGSARCVGAKVVAGLAEEAEQAGHSSPQRDVLMRRLDAALSEASDYIAGLA
jgi:HPt (histidine-containing phosphotransfer) domain-containing protein